MFRPPRLLAPQIVPTAANTPAGRPRLLRPSRTCVVTFARIGYTIRPTTGNWRNEDFHLARFSALSAAPYLCKSVIECLVPYPTVPPSALACFFLGAIGLPETLFRFPLVSANAIFPRAISRGCTHFFMFGPPILLASPGRSYRCEYFRMAAEAFTSGLIVLRCLGTHQICYPSEYRQLTEGLPPS
jgi:hypothetical protein